MIFSHYMTIIGEDIILSDCQKCGTGSREWESNARLFLQKYADGWRNTTSVDNFLSVALKTVVAS